MSYFFGSRRLARLKWKLLLLVPPRLSRRMFALLSATSTSREVHRPGSSWVSLQTWIARIVFGGPLRGGWTLRSGSSKQAKFSSRFFNCRFLIIPAPSWPPPQWSVRACRGHFGRCMIGCFSLIDRETPTGLSQPARRSPSTATHFASVCRIGHRRSEKTRSSPVNLGYQERLRLS